MVQRKVYFAVFGSGLGHITRILEISRRLPQEEFEVRYSTSGQGLGFLRAKGMASSAERSPHMDVDWNPGGGFSSSRVLPRFPVTFNTFLRQLAFERKSILRYRPSVVVSDSRLSAVLAAKSMSLPVITMLNQFKVLFPPRFRSRSGRLYERIAGDSLGLMWSLSDRVLVTDLPPPYTIGEANIAGTDISGVVEYVGFTTPGVTTSEEGLRKTKGMLGLGRRPLVFCPISGPDATKTRLQKALLSSTKDVTRKYDLVVSMGYSHGSAEPRKIGEGAWLFEWCPVKDELMELADLVVSRAGLSTIAQCIEHRKPAVLIPIHNHPEQIANAEKFSKLGLGIDIRSEDLTSDVLLGAVKRCLGDLGYRERLEAAGKVSSRYNGVEKCAEIIRSYA